MKIQPIRICKTKVAFPVIIASLLFTLTLSACDTYNSRPQKLADALGATPDNTLANLKFTLNITDHYQNIYFLRSGDLTNDIIEQAAKSIDPGASVQPGAVLSSAGEWDNDLTYFWSNADPKNLRIILGKDTLRDAIQNKSWLINWSGPRKPGFADIKVHFMEYSATKMALEENGHPITSTVILIETGRLH